MAPRTGIRSIIRRKLKRLDRSRGGFEDDTDGACSVNNEHVLNNAEAEMSGVVGAEHAALGLNTIGASSAGNTCNEPVSISDEQPECPTSTRNVSTAVPVCMAEQSTLTDTLAIGQALAELDPRDLWSVAYREAVETFGEDLDMAILEGQSVGQLFKQLQEFDKQATQDSAFLRGVRYLHSIQVPLDRFKLALDLTSPLANFNPAANAAVGIVKGVTAIAISLAAADHEFAQKIGEMLEQISYIDDCDTLDQKSNRRDIHKALVVVYKKILKFYKVAYQTLTRKGSRLILRIILQNSRLPGVVQDFLREAEILRRLLEKATWEIVQDIKEMLYDQEISRWLGSERMRGQQDHHDALIYATADEACDFLLNEPRFLEWYGAPHSQQLVILGDVGAGKSCAMAFLVDELRRRNASELPRPKLCYHYCQDNKTGTALDIYCCLILALLQQFEGLKKHFHQWHKDAQASGTYVPSRNLEKLESFLKRILEALDRPLFIVIDGLDECDEISRSRILKFLHGTGQTGPAVKVILSCRPQDEIIKELGNISKIYLCSNTQRDKIIAQKSVEIHLSKLSKEVQTLVVENLSRSANGSAIWTEMMAKLIATQRVRAANPMRRFLENNLLPEKLSELYLTLLSNHAMGNSENEELASMALNILATSRRHLSILELSWAVALCSAPREVNSIALLSELVDHERVMGLIQPFIARIDFDDLRKQQVRLIHQSVKEFTKQSLKQTRLRMCGQPVHKTEDDGYESSDEEDFEAGLLNICIRYLLLDEIDQIEIFSEGQRAIEELPQDIDLFDDDLNPAEYDAQCTMEAWEEDMLRYDPTSRGLGELFAYASCHWIDHFGTVTTGPLPRLADIEKLCRPGSMRIQNWIKQNCRPNYTIQARFEFDSSLYDPLSITSLYGSTAVLQDMLSGSGFGRHIFLANPAMSASDQILQWGDLKRLSLLFLEPKLQHELHTIEFFRLIIKYWSHSDKSSENWATVFDLIDHVVDKMVRERWACELLYVAAVRGCLPMVKRLFEAAETRKELRNQFLDDFGSEQGSTLKDTEYRFLQEAVSKNHVDIVQYLLNVEGMEVHIRYRNPQMENVLHLASKTCNPDLLSVLISRFPEGISQRDDQGRTAFMRIMANSSDLPGRFQSAKILLLAMTSDDNTGLGDVQHLLRDAVQAGDSEMCRLLLSTGKANPLSALTRDEDGQVVLSNDLIVEEPGNALPILHLLRSYLTDETVLD